MIPYLPLPVTTQEEWSKEREFIENIVVQRFNFFLVFFSLVIAGAVAATTAFKLKSILTVGMIVSWMITYTLRIANNKLNLILLKLHNSHPFKVIDEQIHGQTGRDWIGYRVPAFCSLVLTVAAPMALAGAIRVSDPPDAPPANAGGDKPIRVSVQVEPTPGGVDRFSPPCTVPCQPCADPCSGSPRKDCRGK